jgi:hypothetical protein
MEVITSLQLALDEMKEVVRLDLDGRGRFRFSFLKFVL